MDRGEPSLKPEWLLRAAGTVAATNLRCATSPRVDHQGNGVSSRNQSSGRDHEHNSKQSSSRRSSVSSGSRRDDGDGTVKSRGYANFGRSSSDRGQEKVSDLHDREAKLGRPDDPSRDGFKSFSSCRPERDRLNQTCSKQGGLNQAVGSLDNVNLSGKDVGDISLGDFPLLGSEDKNRKQEVVRVPSPRISTPTQSIPLVQAHDGWNSVLAEVPMLSEPNNAPVSKSLPSNVSSNSKQLEVPIFGMTLSMAETVIQTPLNISTSPQIDAKKIEERTLRQFMLRPLTPSSNKISVSNSSDKLKAKGARAGDSNGHIRVSQLSVQPFSSYIHTPVKTEPVNPSQSGSFHVLSREKNSVVNAAKDSTSNPLSHVLGQSSSMEPLKKPIVNQKLKGLNNCLPLHLLQGSFGERKNSTKDKHKFFELLRSKSLNASGTAIESSPTLIDEQQNSCLDLSLFNFGIKFNENEDSSCEEANSCVASQRHLSDNEVTNPFLEPDDVFAEGPHRILADSRDASSSLELADTEDVSKKLQTDNSEATLYITPEDVDDASSRPNSGNGNDNLMLEPNEAKKAESYPVVDKPSSEEMAFLLSLGWNEHEVVPPLQQEEIADCLRRNERLQQKIQACRG